MQLVRRITQNKQHIEDILQKLHKCRVWTQWYKEAEYDIETKLIKSTKNIFDRKLGLIFYNDRIKSSALVKGILPVSYDINHTGEVVALVPLIPVPKLRL